MQSCVHDSKMAAGTPIWTAAVVTAIALTGSIPVVDARAQECGAPPEPTFTVDLPKLGLPPDEEGQGWNRPAVWDGYAATSDSITVPNGRPIYALIIAGYGNNAYLDELMTYDFARHLMAEGAYVHWSWWNNLLAPYMERPLHFDDSHPGSTADLTDFTNPGLAADKAVPGEDYQFVADAELLLSAIRAHNPSAMIIIVGHSMGGGALIHLAQKADVVMDLVAPIDPVGNRNYPWAGPALWKNEQFYNWTRWRATRNTFLGFKAKLPVVCTPTGDWLANINDADFGPICIAPHFDDAPPITFGSKVINLWHRWQKENLFPFDYQQDYVFGHAKPPTGTTSQVVVATKSFGADPGGWPNPLISGNDCCPIGAGAAWPGDGHGEIVGYRGPATNVRALAIKVKTSPECDCPGPSWPARSVSGSNWSNGNGDMRVTLLKALEELPLSVPWEHEPYNPTLCLVSPGLIAKYESMNKPPLADAGGAQSIRCNGCTSSPAVLDGSGSVDPDGDALTYKWTWAGGSVAGKIANVNLPVGSHCVTLEVKDPAGHIARDTTTVTVTDAGAAVLPFVRNALAWKEAAGNYEARAFDEFVPGIANALGCLTPTPFAPVVLELEGGTVTVSAFSGSQAVCAIRDSSTTPKVSDAAIDDDGASAVFEFDPPVTAFYTYFGSLASGKTCSMQLFGADQVLVGSMTTPASSHSSLATGLGFTSTTPIARVTLGTNENGAVLVGAFVGLVLGEPSLGTVLLGGYAGPNGPVVDLDFGCTFGATCNGDLNGDGVVDGGDLTVVLGEWGGPGADLNRDGVTDGADITVVLGTWGACP